jgi:AsmA protein
MRALLIFLAAVVVILLGLWGTLVLYFDEQRLKQIATEQVREQTGRDLTIDGELELDLFPGISIVARDVTLSGPPDYAGPALFTADEFRLSVALLPLLSGSVETGDIALRRAEVNIHTDARGRSSLDGLTGDAPAEPAEGPPPDVTTERIALSGIRLVLSDAATDSRQVFVVERLNVDAFRYGEPVPFEFRGSLGEPPVISDISLDGEVTVPYGPGPVQIGRFELEADLSGVPLALSGSAEVRPGPPLRAEFSDGRLRLGEDRFTTAFAFIDGERPRIEASLSGAMLDVDALLPAPQPGAAEAAPDEGGPDAAAESPLLALRDIDLDADLSLEAMKLSGLMLDSVEAGLRAQDGVVSLDPLAAAMNGGRVDARAAIDLTVEPPTVRLSPAFDLDSLSEALAPWGLDRFLAGAGALELELTGRGLTPSALLGSLDGTGRYEFRDGQVRGLDLDGMVDALAARNVAQAVRDGVGGSTAFETLAGTIEIDDGTMALPGMRLITEATGITGDVRLGLADLGLAGEIRFDRERLRNVPIALEGTLTQPRLVPDVGEALREEAGRRVLEFLSERAGGEPEEDDGGNGGG